MESPPTYASLTISCEDLDEVPAKVLDALARLIKRTPASVRASLEIGTITLKKVQLERDLERLVGIFGRNGLSVQIGSPEIDMTDRTLLRLPPKSATGFGLPYAESDAESQWKKGDLIEGLYEVHGSASGGMGTVYFAFHRLWKMMIAIKTPQKAAVKSETHLLRFLREAELWVGLGLHPNIATCYYARVIRGLPRLFIEYVDGGTLEEWAEKGLLRDLRLFTDLMLQFCHGMMYAEENGMVHRDIKPANCLITRDKIVKITDFGLVKRVEDPAHVNRSDDEPISDTTSSGRISNASVTLLEGGIMGSPRYMAPERFREKGKEDIRSDIYSFGVMLYELVLDSMPFKLPLTYSLPELVRSHLKAPVIDPLSLRPDIPRSLADIMVTCIQKKPDNRYKSFQDLCHALESLSQELRPDRKPRNRPNVVGLKADSLNNQAVSLLDLKRDDDARRLLEDAHSANTDHLEAVYNLHMLRWKNSESSDRETIQRMEALKIEVRETPDYSYLMGLVSLQRGDPARAVSFLKKACHDGSWYQDRWKAYDNDPKNFVNSLGFAGIGELISYAGHIKSVRSVAVSSDAKRAYSVGEDRSIRIWDTDSGRCLKNFRTFTFMPVTGAFSQNDEFAATAYGTAFKTLDLWDLREGRLIKKFPGMSVLGVRFSPDSRYLSCYDQEGAIRIFEIPSGAVVWESRKFGSKVSSQVFLGNTGHIAFGLENGSLAMIDFRSGTELFRTDAHVGAVTAVESTSDGEVVLTGGDDELMKLWDAQSGSEVLRFTGHRKKVTGITVLPDDKYIVSVSADGCIKIWDGSSGRCYRTIMVAGEEFTGCALSRDGKRLLTGSSKGSVRLWSIDTGWFSQDYLEPALCRPRTFRELAGLHALFKITVEEFNRSWRKAHQAQALEAFERIRGIPGFCWSKEAVLIRNVLHDVVVRGRLKSTSFIRAFHGHKDAVVAMQASPDNLLLLTGSLDGTAAIWDVVTGRCMRKFVAGNPIREVFFLPRMQGVVTLSQDRMLRVWDRDGKIAKEFPKLEPPLRMMPSGHEITAMSPEKMQVVIDLSTGERDFKGTAVPGSEFICFSENLESVFSLRDSTRIQRWSLATGRNEGAFRDLGIKITALLPATHEDKIISGLETGDLMVYVGGSGVNVATLRGHTAAIRAIVSNLEGNLWITASDDCSIRLWDVAAERCSAVLEGHSSSVRSLALFSNLSLIASGDSEGSARLWGLEWMVSLETKS